VFFGRLAPGKRAPSTLSLAFHDGAGAVLETLPKLDVQASSTGFVYAAPSTALSKTQQQNIQHAVSAKAMTGSDGEPVYLGQAEGTISQFREGYREPQVLGVDGGGCPHCLTYFLCCCMEQTYGMIVNREMLGCSKIKCQYPCEKIKTLEPVPW
jgi:hypothetical protein